MERRWKNRVATRTQVFGQTYAPATFPSLSISVRRRPQLIMRMATYWPKALTRAKATARLAGGLAMVELVQVSAERGSRVPERSTGILARVFPAPTFRPISRRSFGKQGRRARRRLTDDNVSGIRLCHQEASGLTGGGFSEITIVESS